MSQEGLPGVEGCAGPGMNCQVCKAVHPNVQYTCKVSTVRVYEISGLAVDTFYHSDPPYRIGVVTKARIHVVRPLDGSVHIVSDLRGWKCCKADSVFQSLGDNLSIGACGNELDHVLLQIAEEIGDPELTMAIFEKMGREIDGR